MIRYFLGYFKQQVDERWWCAPKEMEIVGSGVVGWHGWGFVFVWILWTGGGSISIMLAPVLFLIWFGYTRFTKDIWLVIYTHIVIISHIIGQSTKTFYACWTEFWRNCSPDSFKWKPQCSIWRYIYPSLFENILYFLSKIEIPPKHPKATVPCCTMFQWRLHLMDILDRLNSHKKNLICNKLGSHRGSWRVMVNSHVLKFVLVEPILKPSSIRLAFRIPGLKGRRD